MNYYISLGNLIMCIDSEIELEQTASILPFYVSAQPADITIHLTWNWKNAVRPATPPIGEDLLLQYFRESENLWCELKGGQCGALSSVRYRLDFSEMFCTVNSVTCTASMKMDMFILRMLPMRELFQYFQILFFHAAQISYSGKGILFSAPSGTGKTTQAKLWQQFRDAEIVCNDRTLIRKQNGKWYTYGYPVDGSEPIHSNQVNELGCVVLLEQGEKNELVSLSAKEIVSRLMGQNVIDCWNPQARIRAMQLILTLVNEIPVLCYYCKPDASAVEVLEQILREKEVIFNG